MRLRKLYAVRFKGEDGVRWVRWTLMGWDIVEKFEANCLVELPKAAGFLDMPGTDPRYELYAVELTATKA